MMKKCYRFFGGFLDAQESWLNQMAHQGYRLVRTGKVAYEFERCDPDEYQYSMEFVAHKSYKSEKEYKAFLEELGYKVFYKNANLNFSVGKIKWRPYGSGMGQISTNPGSYNKELFIVEKKNDGKPFELHTMNSDKANYYKPLRNAWLTVLLLLFALSAFGYINTGFLSYDISVFALLGLLCAIPVARCQQKISAFSANAHIEE